jgi:hypothetical protein
MPGASRVATAAPRSLGIELHCAGCSVSPLKAQLQPALPAETDPDVVEVLASGEVTFPAPGTWTLEPLGVDIHVRSPTSNDPPLVEIRSWSQPLPSGCSASSIAAAVSALASGANRGEGDALAQVLASDIDLSLAGGSLPTMTAHGRSDAIALLSARQKAGERLYPFLVYAASGPQTGSGLVDLAISVIRDAPDLGTQRLALAGSALRCTDGMFLRFNAAVTGS